MSDDRMRSIRRDYEATGIDLETLDESPTRQFDRWLDDAISAGVPEPNAMTLATVDPRGRPTARAVLLKSLDEAGVVFFTNLTSAKAQQLARNPAAAVCFVWIELHRQVRIEGTVATVDPAESDAYFSTRPRDAQIGAHASPQSQEIPDREWLERRVAELTEEFAGRPVPRPDHWGGLRLTPDRFEFWQGRPNRLHDRIVYLEPPRWRRVRLAP